MSNLKRTYAEIISQAQVMATGLKANQAEVARKGIDTGFVTELEKTRLEAIALNDEQEKFKSALKIKTEELNAKMDIISAKLSEAKKVVKLSIPKAQWLEFGIGDKR